MPVASSALTASAFDDNVLRFVLPLPSGKSVRPRSALLLLNALSIGVICLATAESRIATKIAKRTTSYQTNQDRDHAERRVG
jgi:hypothetical protein